MSITPRKRAIIHTRVSTAEQADNTSHNSQLAAALKKADELGADVIATFKEEVSGALFEARPDIQTSLSMIEDGRADMVIFARLDRAGREVGNLREVKKRIEQAGGKLVFADGLQFQEGAIGNLLYTQLAGFAEFEREIIRERVVTGLVATANSGKQPARALSPYGYRIPKHVDAIRGECLPDDVGKYFIVEEQAKIVRRAFEMYSNGASLNSIALALNEQGVPTARGGAEWRATTIRSILRNEAYIGQPAYRKTKHIVDEKRHTRGFSKIGYEQLRPKEERIYLSAPRLVSDELFQRVQGLLDTARRDRSGRSDRKYMLSGLFWCSICGSRMLHASGATKGYNYPAHLCREARTRRTSDQQRCKSKKFTDAIVERLVIDAIVHLIENQQIMVDAAQKFEADQRAKIPRNAEKDLKALEKSLTALRKREETTIELQIDARMDGLSTEPYESVLQNLAARKSDLEAGIERLKAVGTPTAIPAVSLPSDATELRAVLESADVPGSTKHQILWTILDRIYARGYRQNTEIEIVLYTQPKLPLYIVTNSAGKISMRVEATDPFPRKGNERQTYALER